MSPELAALELRLKVATEPLTAAQMQLTPTDRPDCWSIQQILEHLMLTYKLTCATFETRLAKAKPTRARPGMAQRLGQFTLIKLGHFPYGRTAPENVYPGSPSILQSGQEMAVTLHAELERLDVLISRAEVQFGLRTQAISHQILGPLTAQQWRTFHLVHGLHHLKQIGLIRRAHSV